MRRSPRDMSDQERDALLDRILDDRPKLHRDEFAAVDWSPPSATLRYLYSLIQRGDVTLETGCGLTTVLFAIAGAHHTCVTLDPGEARRVQTYCVSLGVSDDVVFATGSSDVVLPATEAHPATIDHLLVDGAHRFPFPVLDWHYGTKRLRVGGVVGIDDYRIPSVAVLCDFLRGEPEWELIRTVENTVFCRKLREPDFGHGEWASQQMNRAHFERSG
jgi:hypothetical protein